MSSSHLIVAITILFTIINAQGPPAPVPVPIPAPSSCGIDNGGCHQNASCTQETNTSVICRCNLGFDDLSSGDGTNCSLIQSTVCENACAANSECFPVRIQPGNLQSGTRPFCRCLPFFEGDGTNTCDNIDDCVNATCADGLICVDGLGNFTCAPPPSCDIDNGGCDGNATCSSIANGTSINCECNLGFDDLSGGDGTNCTLIQDNICDPPNNGGCAENAACFPARIVPGDLQSGIRPECVCNGPFFEGDGTNTCTNIDDCVNATCADRENCVDGLGNFTCVPAPSCDIDNGGCDGNATCRILADNTTIDCECNSGFDDISPLVDGTNCTLIQTTFCDNGGPCAENAVCIPVRIIAGNLQSGLAPSCRCDGPFFEGDGFNTCENIDDCVNATCGIGTCVDGLGNFTCDCGVIAQGDQCEILNDCYNGRDCMNGGICINDTVNGNSCNCNSEGFIGILCEIDVDECNGVAVVCGPNSSCRNTNGSFACDCDDGYEGDGKDLEMGCTNINECQPVNPCGANADCTDLDPPPGFNCQCQSGFEGDAFGTNGTGCTLIAQQNPATISTTDDDNSGSISDSNSDSSSWDDALLFMENRIKDNYGDDNNYDHETRITLDISTWSLLNIGAFMATFVCLNLAIMCLYSSKSKRRVFKKSKKVHHDDNAFSDESDC